jgi:hypothetical protein
VKANTSFLGITYLGTDAATTPETRVYGNFTVGSGTNSKSAIIKGTLQVTGASALNGDVTVGTAAVSKGIKVYGSIETTESITVGSSSNPKTFTVYGNVEVFATGDSVFYGDLYVGDPTGSSTAGALVIGNSSTVDIQKLTVYGTATFTAGETATHQFYGPVEFLEYNGSSTLISVTPQNILIGSATRENYLVVYGAATVTSSIEIGSTKRYNLAALEVVGVTGITGNVTFYSKGSASATPVKTFDILYNASSAVGVPHFYVDTVIGTSTGAANLEIYGNLTLSTSTSNTSGNVSIAGELAATGPFYLGNRTSPGTSVIYDNVTFGQASYDVAAYIYGTFKASKGITTGTPGSPYDYPSYFNGTTTVGSSGDNRVFGTYGTVHLGRGGGTVYIGTSGATAYESYNYNNMTIGQNSSTGRRTLTVNGNIVQNVAYTTGSANNSPTSLKQALSNALYYISDADVTYNPVNILTRMGSTNFMIDLESLFTILSYCRNATSLNANTA